MYFYLPFSNRFEANPKIDRKSWLGQSYSLFWLHNHQIFRDAFLERRINVPFAGKFAERSQLIRFLRKEACVGPCWVAVVWGFQYPWNGRCVEICEVAFCSELGFCFQLQIRSMQKKRKVVYLTSFWHTQPYKANLTHTSYKYAFVAR